MPVLADVDPLAALEVPVGLAVPVVELAVPGGLVVALAVLAVLVDPVVALAVPVDPVEVVLEGVSAVLDQVLGRDSWASSFPMRVLTCLWV